MESFLNPFTGEKRDPVHLVFCNDLIAPEILGYLSVMEWTAFRLVCLEWYKMTIKLENTKVFVHLQTRYNDDDNGESNASIKHFLGFLETTNQVTESHGRYQFKQFSLEDWNTKNVDPNKNLNIYRRFSDVCGQQIRHLRLVNFRVRKDDQAFQNLIGNHLTPNIKTLDIVANKEWTGAFDYLSPIFLKADVNPNLKRLEIYWSPDISLNFVFLMKFPNLKELKLDVEGRVYAERLIHNLIMLGPRRKKQKALLNLNHLDLIESDQNICSLVAANLPLKFLSLHIPEVVKADQFKVCLEHHPKLLETLKLIRLPFQRSPPFGAFPFSAKFAKLKELELWGNITENLNFLMVTPALKRLRIDLYCFEKGKTFPDLFEFAGGGRQLAITEDLVQISETLLQMETFTVPSLEEFVIDAVLKVESWKILGAWFPRLKVLEAPLNNDSLEIDCSQWKGLSRLKLRLGSDVDNNGITGLGNGAVRKPNTTDLKDLYSFGLEVSCGKGRLTDVAAENGFLLMSNLSSLKVQVSVFMSLEMESRLKTAIKDVQICRKPIICRRKFCLNCCEFKSLMSDLNVTKFY